MGEVDSEKIIAAAKEAGVHEMILKLPQGYDTPIGEAGTVLSGGQRQRIALARAIYGKPVFVVLDEPNSNLDDMGEKALVETLSRMKTKRITTIIVTHKPSLLAHVDKVLILKNGQVAAYGPREDVFKQLMGPVSP
jgi:ABC-type protease/lipase transport system fused ATPase/permease subunit